VPLLDADRATKTVRIETLRPARLKLALGVALGLLAMCVAGGLMFFLAPKQTRKTVREVVQAAEALVQKSPLTPADKEAGEDETLTAGKRGGRPLSGSTRLRQARQAVVRRIGPTAAHAHPPVGAAESTAESPRLQHAELPLGTAGWKVREMFGEPDLELYTLEKEHEVEHLVYVNRAQNNATSVLLVDGRVASVSSGMPSVWSWR
jgi:uncharacterized protein YjeT (DUF2065 family)